MEPDRHPAPREPYGTGIRDAIARRDFDELRAFVGTVEMSLQELAKHDAEELADVAGIRLSPEKSEELRCVLEQLRSLLHSPAK